MSPKIYLFILTFVVLSTAASADIFKDFLGWDLISTLTGDSDETKTVTKKTAVKRDDEDEEGGNACSCVSDGCNCCVDFNLTSIIDLGGPGCVKMRYISQEEGVTVNVSYGDSLLHSKVLKQNDKKGSCMNLLSEFAQICARFDDLKPTDDGLQGCLHFEPHVLGEVTAKYHIGCFLMSPGSMIVDPNAAIPEEPAQEESAQQEEENEEEETPSILDVVNQSAEQGIAFFTDLLGIKVPGSKQKTTTEKAEVTDETSADPEEESDEESERRNFGSVKTSRGRSISKSSNQIVDGTYSIA